MSKKLEKNGMWESSRMMLPEHRESLLEQNRALTKKTKPELEEQLQEEIARAVDISLKRSKLMTFVLFNELQNRELVGTVREVDTGTRRIKVGSCEEEEWIDFSDIMEVYSKS